MNIVKEAHLGAGTYGDVYRTIDRNNGDHVVALKAMKNNTDGDIRRATIRELFNTQNLLHPNIISVAPLVYNDGSRHSVYINPDKRSIELSLEMMNGDIYSLKPEQLTPELLRKLVHDVTKGLYHMHSMGYTHNDLKPDNILYKLQDGEYTFKIGDFGLSQYLGIPFPEAVNTFLSTPTVKAPNSKDNSYFIQGNRYNYNSDMFSLGATMFWICMKVHGIRWSDFRISEREVFVDIRKQNFLDTVDRLKAMYGEEGFDFLIRCMEPNSRERMTSKQALEHPYLRPLRGGAIGDLFAKLNRIYRQPTIADITSGSYELEFMEDMYNNYKDRRVNLYLDFATKTQNVNQRKLMFVNSWIFKASNLSMIETIETFFQFQLTFINLLNNKKLGVNSIKTYGVATFFLSHKIFSKFASNYSSLDDLIRFTNPGYTKREIINLEKYVLQNFDGNIPVTPVMFFLNYWYLKSIYTGERKEPNVNVLNTSVAVMLALLVSNTKPELENVMLDDLAKYCVHKALRIQRYTDSANISILTGPGSIDWAILDACIPEFCANVWNAVELYMDVKNIIVC